MQRKKRFNQRAATDLLLQMHDIITVFLPRLINGLKYYFCFPPLLLIMKFETMSSIDTGSNGGSPNEHATRPSQLPLPISFVKAL